MCLARWRLGSSGSSGVVVGPEAGAATGSDITGRSGASRCVIEKGWDEGISLVSRGVREGFGELWWVVIAEITCLSSNTLCYKPGLYGILNELPIYTLSPAPASIVSRGLKIQE